MAKKKSAKKAVGKVAKKAIKKAVKKTAKKIAKKAITKKKTTRKVAPAATPDPHETFFHKITDELARGNKSVTPGNMMSSPGIRYKNKVFAFYYNQNMVFRLGKEFDPATQGISDFTYLSPFKNKPPMKAWFQIPTAQKRKWSKLAGLALEKMKSEIG